MVQSKVGNYGQVTITCNAPIMTTVVQIAQRDLFRKYSWPAAPDILAKLEALKETVEES